MSSYSPDIAEARYQELLGLVSRAMAINAAAFAAAGNNNQTIDPGTVAAASITLTCQFTTTVSGRVTANADWSVGAFNGGTAAAGDTVTFTFSDGTTTLTQSMDIGTNSKAALCSFDFNTVALKPALGTRTLTMTATCNNGHTIGTTAGRGSIVVQELSK